MTDKKTYGTCCRLNLQSLIFIVCCTNLIMILSFCMFSYVYVDFLMHERKVWVKKSNFAGESIEPFHYMQETPYNIFLLLIILL